MLNKDKYTNGKPSPQQRAKLRVCASCEWIFKGNGDCPKCNFATYGARYVCGSKCYRYHKTQEPWIKRKMDEYRWSLQREIDDN